MSEKTTQTEKSAYNKFWDMGLWLVSLVLLAIALWANYHYRSVDLSLRLIAWLFLAAVIVGLVWQTTQGRQTWQFSKEARIELRKVVWPSRQETIRITLMVVVLVLILALIIWGIDAIFLHLMGWLTGQ